MCSQFFPSILELRNHVSGHEEQFKKLLPKQLSCTLCELNFGNNNDLKYHLETNHQQVKNEIDEEVIEIKFSPQENSETNLLEEPESKTQNENDISQKNIIYKCTICKMEFNFLSNIKGHLATHNIRTTEIFKNITFKCIECENSEEYNTIYDHFQHSLTHKNVPTSPKVVYENSKKRYCCNACDKTFTTRFNLMKHKDIHENNWPKKCKFCDELLQTRAEYMTHFNEKHDDLKGFVCNHCGKKFFKERNLQCHKSIHTGERNYMCDICGFSFHAQNNLVSILFFFKKIV